MCVEHVVSRCYVLTQHMLLTGLCGRLDSTCRCCDGICPEHTATTCHAKFAEFHQGMRVGWVEGERMQTLVAGRMQLSWCSSSDSSLPPAATVLSHQCVTFTVCVHSRCFYRVQWQKSMVALCFMDGLSNIYVCCQLL
jgi:hypothetical protein